MNFAENEFFRCKIVWGIKWRKNFCEQMPRSREKAIFQNPSFVEGLISVGYFFNGIFNSFIDLSLRNVFWVENRHKERAIVVFSDRR